MADPFATALVALHGAAGSVAAVYFGADGITAPIRIIRSQPSQEFRLGEVGAVYDANTFEVRREDAPMIAAGDLLDIDGEMFRINQVPELDVEGVTWIVRCEPIT